MEQDIITTQKNEIYFDQIYFNKIKALESTITLIQTSIHNSNQIILQLKEVSAFLKEVLSTPVDEISMEKVNRFIKKCFAGIDLILQNSQFNGQYLFDGSFNPSVMVNTNAIEVIRSLNYINIKEDEKIELKVLKQASKSFIIGDIPVNESILKQEQKIIIYFQDKFIQYQIKENETVDSFIIHLQNALNHAHISIDVSLTDQGYLLLSNKQFGSKYKFRAQSMQSALISNDKGQVKHSQEGEDCYGELNGMPCIGNGRFLISKNKQFSGIIFYLPENQNKTQTFEVSIKKQKELYTLDDSNTLFFTIPNISLKSLARGVDNKSNFRNLSEINILEKNQFADATFMIHWAIEELSLLNDKWKKNEKEVVYDILNLIKKSTLKETNQMVSSSFNEEKAKNISDFLRTRLIQRKENKKNQQNCFV